MTSTNAKKDVDEIIEAARTQGDWPSKGSPYFDNYFRGEETDEEVEEKAKEGAGEVEFSTGSDRPGTGTAVTHWCYGHFHQSWHTTIDGILFKMLDIMELYSLP